MWMYLVNPGKSGRFGILPRFKSFTSASCIAAPPVRASLFSRTAVRSGQLRLRIGMHAGSPRSGCRRFPFNEVNGEITGTPSSNE